MAYFCGFLCICGYHERISEQNSHTATRNVDSSSCASRPGLWIHKSQLLLQQLPLSPIVVNSFLLLTSLGPCLSSSFSDLVGNLVRKPFYVDFAPKQTKQSSDWRTHRNECPPSCQIFVLSSSFFCYCKRYAVATWRNSFFFYFMAYQP